jgi:hypothetical protein
VTVDPAVYLPFALAARTELTVGADVSMTIAFDPPNESPLEVAGSVTTALLPEMSVMLPEFKVSDDVLT